VIFAPPSRAGGENFTVTCASPGAVEMMVGRPGAPAVISTLAESTVEEPARLAVTTSVPGFPSFVKVAVATPLLLVVSLSD
jgi:hypothetical protein